MDSTTASYSELVCTICLDLLSESPSNSRNDGTPSIFTTKCGHLFHEECIKKALKVKKVCPNCQENPVTTRSLRKVFLPLNPGQCVRCNEREEQVNDSHEEKLELEKKLTRAAKKVREKEKENKQLKKLLKDRKDKERKLRKYRKRASKLGRRVDKLTEDLKRERKKVDQLEMRLDEQEGSDTDSGGSDSDSGGSDSDSRGSDSDSGSDTDSGASDTP